MNPTLKENHYVYVPEFIDTARAQELTQEFLELERQGLYSKDAQAPNAPATYNFLPFVRLMVEKISFVSELCGEPVLPTYTYARIYKHGATLGRHRDRDACEISFTLNLAQDTDWPIHIQIPNGQEVALNLKPGDAMMYLGCEADHWRERFIGHNHVQLFLHYVRAYGPRAYTFFNIAREPASNRPQHAQPGAVPDTKPEFVGARAATPELIPQPSQRPAQKLGRNEPCPCGSGKKYKHCHGKASAAANPVSRVSSPLAARPATEPNVHEHTAPGKPDAQFQALVRAKYAGNPHAMTALGARLIVGRDSPVAPVDGAVLLAEAAEQGSAEAYAYIAILAAAGVGRPQSWPDALDALNRAASLGHERSVQQVQLLRTLGLLSVTDLVDWLSAATGRALSEAPEMVTYSGFLTADLCSYLIDIAAPRRVQAQVHDLTRGVLKVDSMRTNTGAAFSLIDTDLVMQLVRARIARAAHVAPSTLEPLEILHYSVGQTFKPHVDFFHPSIPHFAEQMRIKGQRVKTCLIYLNDDFEGGETDFSKVGIKFRGRSGEALVFSNVTADGEGDLNTLHAGLPPTRGEKWLLSQWIRNKPQPVA